jgi:hypothetical protein
MQHRKAGLYRLSIQRILFCGHLTYGHTCNEILFFGGFSGRNTARRGKVGGCYFDGSVHMYHKN